MKVTMANQRVVKQERSVSVQGRVDIVKLAEVFAGLRMNNYNVGTMSLLVSYCVEIAHSALEQNGLLKKKFDSIGDAYLLLKDSGVMTKSMIDRNIKKINMAWGFENLRNEGDDPEISAPRYYKGLHNDNSVEIPKVQQFTKADAMAMVENYEKFEREKMLEQAKIDSEKMIKYQQSKMVNGVYTPLDGHDTVTKLPVAKPEEKPKLGRPPKVEKPKVEPPECKIDPEETEMVNSPIYGRVSRKEYNRLRHEDQMKSAKKYQANKTDDTPRQKTSEELDAEAKRIEEKDRAQLALFNSDAMLGPK